MKKLYMPFFTGSGSAFFTLISYLLEKAADPKSNVALAQPELESMNTIKEVSLIVVLKESNSNY